MPWNEAAANILIVDDQEHNIKLLERILTRAGYTNLHSTLDPLQLPIMLREIDPDIVLLDLHMPGMDGIQALKLIREHAGADHYLPVLMLTADITPQARQEALEAGVNDFLTKPFDRTEVVLRMNNLLRTRDLHNQLHEHNVLLEQRVQERTAQLQRAQNEMIELLGRAAEYRDDETGLHTRRVGELSGRVAEQLNLPPHTVKLIRMAAPLHDIGKIGIPDELLLKPGRFEPEQFEQMKKHTSIGADILKNSVFDMLQLAEVIARSHHEKWNGTGYPDQLQGEQIPIEARIVAIADFYDALTHDRPYKKAWTDEEAIAEIKRQSGEHFDPRVVEAFLEVIASGAMQPQ